jgi:hypothetical protein
MRRQVLRLAWENPLNMNHRLVTSVRALVLFAAFTRCVIDVISAVSRPSKPRRCENYSRAKFI